MNVRYFEKRPGAWHLDFKDATGKRVRPYGGTTRAAAEAAAPGIIGGALVASAMPKDSAKAGDVVAVGITFEDAYKRGLKEREKWITSKAKGSLQTTFDSIAGSHKDLSPTVDMGYFTRERVRALRAHWLEEDGKRKGTKLSPSTINHRLSFVSVLLEVCDLEPHNVKHMPTKGNERRRRVSDTELGRMQQWCTENRERSAAITFARLITAGIETGARLGELLSLTDPDVNVEELHVTFRNTKNRRTRTVPITRAAATVLSPRKGLAGPFADITDDRVTALWSEMRRDMGLERDTNFIFHILRHEFGSRLGDRGENAYNVMGLMGHEDIKTSEVYVQASMGGMRRALGTQQPVSQPA